MVNTATLTEDRAAVGACIVTMGGKLVASQALKIYIPYRYFDRKLASLGTVVSTACIFCVVLEDGRWGLCSMPNQIHLTPASTTMDKMDDEDYMVLSFAKGGTISNNSQLTRNTTVVYDIYDRFYSSGYRPWFVDYDNYCKLLQHADRCAGIRLSHNNCALELTVAQICKNPDDRTVTYRHILKDGYDKKKVKAPYVAPLQSVLFNANNTSTRIVGAYLNQGILSAMTYRSERSEPIEELLRS